MTLRLERIVPALAGLLLAAAVLVAPWPPSSDLSLHEGMVGLLAHLGDASFAPAGLYRLSLGHANQLVYLLAWPLARVAGAALACRVVLAATVFATMLGASHLADHLGRSRWAVLALAPVTLGWAFYWGFLPQMLGFAMLLALLPALDRDARSDAPLTVLPSAFTIAFLGLAHVTSMVGASLASLLFTLVRPLTRRTPPKLLPGALGLGLAVLEDRWDRAVSTPLAQLFASRVLWHPLPRKLAAAMASLIGAYGLLAEVTVGLLVLMAVVLWRTTESTTDAVEPVAAAPLANADAGGRRARLERHRFALLAGVFVALYLAAPYSVNFGAFLYVRFLAPAFALAVLLAAPRARARGPLVIAPALALLVAPLVLLVPPMSAARAQSLALDPLLARIPQGSSVAVLHLGKYDHGLPFDPTSFGNRVLGERGGRVLSSLTEYPIAPVSIAPGARWDSLVLRVSARSGSLRPRPDLQRLGWVLVHVHDPSLPPLLVSAFAPEASLEDARGEWLLFRSRLPQVALTAADAPADAAGADAETLQDRVSRALAAGAAPASASAPASAPAPAPAPAPASAPAPAPGSPPPPSP